MKQTNKQTNDRKLTMHIFLRDAVGPDERGEPTHICLEDTLMDRELQVLACEDYRVLVIVIDNCADGW